MIYHEVTNAKSAKGYYYIFSVLYVFKVHNFREPHYCPQSIHFNGEVLQGIIIDTLVQIPGSCVPKPP